MKATIDPQPKLPKWQFRKAGLYGTGTYGRCCRTRVAFLVAVDRKSIIDVAGDEPSSSGMSMEDSKQAIEGKTWAHTGLCPCSACNPHFANDPFRHPRIEVMAPAWHCPTDENDVLFGPAKLRNTSKTMASRIDQWRNRFFRRAENLIVQSHCLTHTGVQYHSALVVEFRKDHLVLSYERGQFSLQWLDVGHVTEIRSGLTPLIGISLSGAWSASSADSAYFMPSTFREEADRITWFNHQNGPGYGVVIDTAALGTSPAEFQDAIAPIMKKAQLSQRAFW